MCKEGRAGNKKRRSRSLLVFSELPCLPSTGSWSGCFHTSLGCKPRSLIRDSLGWFDYSKKMRKGDPTPACSPVIDRRCLTALVEVHWARRVRAAMPHFSGLNSQENNKIETCTERGAPFPHRKPLRWETGMMELFFLTRLPAPWTDGRPHPRIINQLARGNKDNVNL
jgi:hypothetical protein